MGGHGAVVIKVAILDAEHGVDDVGRHVLCRDLRQSESTLVRQVSSIRGLQHDDPWRRELGDGRKIDIVQCPGCKTRRQGDRDEQRNEHWKEKRTPARAQRAMKVRRFDVDGLRHG
jgi:hypothetical protein